VSVVGVVISSDVSVSVVVIVGCTLSMIVFVDVLSVVAV